MKCPPPTHNLNPTLWRTCKMLAGHTRIRLLRQLHLHPGEGVTSLGRRVGIGEPAASQELRRIQSRGLLQAERKGALLAYRMAPDPQVPSSAPILKALQTALRDRPPESDVEMTVLATGLSHPRRIQIVRALLLGPRPLSELQFETRIPSHPFHEHLRTLAKSGFVARATGTLHFAIPDHPLARALAKLLQQGVSR